MSSHPILEGRFELTETLSQTDFSTEYLACDRHYLHRPHCRVIAVRYRQIEMRHRLEREAQILEKLGQHPQIPRVLAYFHAAEQPKTAQSAEKPDSALSSHTFYIVRDHIIGHPLTEEITAPKQLSESYVIKLLKDVLVPLSFAHERGAIHQNLHPQYLIRQRHDGEIFLTQFGAIAKLARSKIEADGSLSSTVPVSPQPYIAPEQLQQQSQPASDLYALGLIAIEALIGRSHHDLPYDPAKGLLWREQVPELSLPLAEFIDRLVRYDWRDRFTNATEALNTLKAENARHQIANDSRLATVIAAPGMRERRSPQPSSGFGSANVSAWPTPVPTQMAPSRKTYRVSVANPYFFKLVIGSVATVLALGIGVKTYQWGEYRLSRLPQSWQDWRQEAPAATPSSGAPSSRAPSSAPPSSSAIASELVPLMADGSLLMQPAAAKAFWQMVVAAQEDGVSLYPLSAYRISAAADAQDYATGYAVDIGGEAAATDKQASFAQTEAFKWLKQNASSHGFEQFVGSDRSLTDRLLKKASAEPWHWRYVGD